jgi:DNA polymerase-1
VVQGSAADLIKLAMLHVHAGMPAAVPGARMLLQIHDELVFEVPAPQAAALDAFVRGAMEHAMALRVPLVVGSAWGPTWADA